MVKRKIAVGLAALLLASFAVLGIAQPAAADHPRFPEISVDWGESTATIFEGHHRFRICSEGTGSIQVWSAYGYTGTATVTDECLYGTAPDLGLIVFFRIWDESVGEWSESIQPPSW